MVMKTRLGGREHWGDLTDDELTQVASKRDALLGLGPPVRFEVAQSPAGTPA